jgi:hypothetical protein
MNLLQRLNDALGSISPSMLLRAAANQPGDHVCDNDQELARFIEGDDRPETILHLLGCEPCRVHAAWLLDAVSSRPPATFDDGRTADDGPLTGLVHRTPALALIERDTSGHLVVAHATCAVRRVDSLTLRQAEPTRAVWLRDQAAGPRVEIGVIPDHSRFHLAMQWLDPSSPDADVTLTRHRRVIARARLGAATTLIPSLPDGLIHARFCSGEAPLLDLWLRLPS